MEDFAREIKAGSALFLLYGDERVGKSRLLEELIKTRLGDNRVHGIELRSTDQDGKGSQDRSAEIEKTFVRAREGDTIIADHFEAALKKTRHQLFLSWSTDGVDKHLNLIVCSSNDGFNELRQLASQYRVRVQSFQLMPLSPDEIEAFLGFYLFPNHPIGKLTIPPPLRKQLADTRGILGRVIDLADREGARIETAPLAETESIRQGSWVIASVLVVVLLAAAVGWYLFSGPERHETVADVPTQPEIDQAAAPESEPPSETEPAHEPGEVEAADSAIESEEEIETESEEEVLALAAAEETAPAIESEPAVEIPAEPEPGTVPEDEALAAAEETPVAETEIDSSGIERRFLRDLQSSLDWLDNRPAEAGTVQILLLTYADFDPQAYYEFVDRLENGGVDVSRLRIFKTLTANKRVYSVVYDEFGSRQLAKRAIPTLPRVIRDTSPIPRSVGGLWEEIQRLEQKN